jgi:hypothetical protein
MEGAMPPRLLLCELNSVLAAILANELIVEILSLLLVKHVIQLRCVNNFFTTFTIDPHFVQMHLNKSSRNSQLALMYLVDHDSSLATLSHSKTNLPSFMTIFTTN